MRMKAWTLSPPQGDQCWWSLTVWRKASSVESVTFCHTLLLNLCTSFSQCDWSVSCFTSLGKTAHVSLFFFPSPGAIPAWSWCCGDHQKTLSAASRGTPFTNTWNSKQRLRSPRPLVLPPPLPPWQAHLQTQTPLGSLCLQSLTAARRKWRWNKAPRHPKTRACCPSDLNLLKTEANLFVKLGDSTFALLDIFSQNIFCICYYFSNDKVVTLLLLLLISLNTL